MPVPTFDPIAFDKEDDPYDAGQGYVEKLLTLSDNFTTLATYVAQAESLADLQPTLEALAATAESPTLAAMASFIADAIANDELLTPSDLASAIQELNLPAGDVVGTNDQQTLTSKTLGRTAESVNAMGSLGGGAIDIDLSLGNIVTATVDTAATTFSLSNPTAASKCGGIVIWLTNGGSQSITWPATVKIPEAGLPDLTVAGLDKLVLETIDGGASFTLDVVGLNYA
ncbi:MAG: hypothetical protein R3332_08285 [Pseudohongiellaceae bacterium]|nr:hypothetical protein [Pseudohongiellaceae bacterium]